MNTRQTFLSFVLLIAALPIWAEDFSPVAEKLFRTSNDNTSWVSGFPKSASETNYEFEMKYWAGFYALQKYTITNLDAATSLTLNIAGPKDKGTDAIALWVFSDNAWTEISSAEELTGKVTEIVGIAPHATEGDASTDYLMNTCGQNRETVDDVQYCHFVIQGDALTRLKEAATDNTFSLLITNRTQDLKSDTQRKYYSSGHATETCRPYISATYPTALVQQEIDGVTSNTYCGTLNEAFDAITSSGTITLFDDITITSRCNTGAKNIIVTAVKDVKISSSLNSSIWILNNNGSGKLTIGSEDYQITIDGNNITNNANHLEVSGNSTTTLNNIKFTNCISSKATNSSGQGGIINNKGGGTLYLKNCVFEGCTASTQNDDSGIIFVGTTNVSVQQNILFVNCIGNDFFAEQFLRIGDMSEPAAPITIYRKNAALNAVVLSMGGNYQDRTSWFKVVNDNFGLAFKPSNADHILTEAYTLTMNKYGASTLILPFECKIPEGVSLYTLSYTAGAESATAAQVNSTLPANTPVLVNAEADNKYWFVNTTIVDEATAGSGTHTFGALTGVYETTSVPEESYILFASDDKPIGFYKANNNTVGANRAYLTAYGSGVKALMIDFGGADGIGDVNRNVNLNEKIYNLAGQRVNRTQKGLYIINGKKVLVK